MITAFRVNSWCINTDPSIVGLELMVYDHFKLISLLSLTDIVEHLKSTFHPGASHPFSLLKRVFKLVGPSLLCLINTSISTGCVPYAFEDAVVEPVFKKLN